MTDQPQTWCCNDCPTAIIMPPMMENGETTREWIEVAIEIGRHRLAHFTDRLTGATDEEIMMMSGDEPPLKAAAVVAEAERIVRRR